MSMFLWRSLSKEKLYFSERLHLQIHNNLIYVTCSIIGSHDRSAKEEYCTVILRRSKRIHESEILLFTDSDHWNTWSTIHVFIVAERVCSYFGQIIEKAFLMVIKRILLLFCNLVSNKIGTGLSYYLFKLKKRACWSIYFWIRIFVSRLRYPHTSTLRTLNFQDIVH